MEVKLVQHEIEKAVRLYLAHEEGMKLEGRKLEIEFTAGRNPPTVSADIKILKDDSGATADAVIVKDEAPTPEDTPFSDEQEKLPFQEFLS
jgi:hypothetical protein